MTGDYCPGCAQQEQCAACSEMVSINQITWKHDIKNYICNGCMNDYHTVADYIKTAPFRPPEGKTKTISEVTRKAA